jgi:hypothetical protein
MKAAQQDNHASARPPRAATLWFVVAALFWTGTTLVFEFMLVWSGVRNFQSNAFSKTEGQVTQSSFVETSTDFDSGQATYVATIAFRYRAAGKEYERTGWRFGWWSGDLGFVQHITHTYPVGRKVDVFYDPSDPAQAVLEVGLQSGDLLLAMPMLFMDLVAALLWAIVSGRVEGRDGQPDGPVQLLTGRVKSVRDGFVTRVRMGRTRPWLAGLGFAGIAALVGFFVMSFLGGARLPLHTMALAWWVILGVGVIANAHAWVTNYRSSNDLRIDEAGQSLTVARSFGRSERLVVPLSKTLVVEIEKIKERLWATQTAVRYAVLLTYCDQDGGRNSRKLTEWLSRRDATTLATWLRDRLQLRAPGDHLSEDGSKFPECGIT